MYNIVKTGFIIEFNDRAEIQQHSSEEGGGVLSAVASARDIGRRRDQPHITAHTSAPAAGTSSSVPVIEKITSPQPRQWVRSTHGQSNSFTFECTWSFDQTLPIICELPALIVIKNGLRSREQDPNKWWYRIYRQEYSLVKGSSGGIQRRLCRDWDIYKEIISQSRYQNFLKMHPDGRISRKSFHTMMKECYPGADTEKLERHIFRMYDSNKVSHGPGLRHEGHWQ